MNGEILLPNMPRGKQVTNRRTQQYLLTVLDLLLDFACHGETTWKVIENGIKKEKTSKGRVSGLSIDQVVNITLAPLKKSLMIKWLPSDESGGVCDGDLQADRTWLHLQEAESSAPGTTEAIHACLRYRKLAAMIGPAPESEFVISLENIRNALTLMSQLDLYKQLLDRDPQGASHRHFALDFSSCQPRSPQNCRSFVEQKLNQNFPTSTTTRLRTSTNSDPNSKLIDQLDAWVSANLESWRTRFEGLDDVRARRIHVPLNTAINLAPVCGDQQLVGAEPKQLHPVDLRGVVAAPGSQMLLLWEEGGAGKTSLAFQIARWALDGHLADHALLPVLLDPANGEGDVVERLHSQLRHLGDPKLTRDFVEDLLRHRRLLPIVDHVSELSDQQRQWLSRELPPHLVLLTSRRRENQLFSNWSISELQPQRLEGEALLSFFEAYLAAKGQQVGTASSAALLSAEDQMHTRDLLERMVGNKPITVLLVCLVIDKALDHIAEGRIELLPSSVPELMLDYVQRSFQSIAPKNRRLADGTLLQAGWVADSLKALALAAHRQNHEAYRPQNFALPLALETLGEVPRVAQALASEEQRRDLVLYLQDHLNLLQRKGGSDRNPIYRVTLDPLADYLAALALMEELNGGQPATSVDDSGYHQRVRDWLDLLDRRLEREPGDAGALMRGFLAACRDGYKELLSRAPSSLDPELKRNWQDILHTFARLAGIDPLEERKLEARHLIRRHAGDLFWSNPELLPKAIAELSAFAREFVGGKELEQALIPLARTMAKTTLPEQVRAAAAEALGYIGGGAAATALVRVIENVNEPYPAVRRAAAEALGLVECEPDPHWRLLEEILASEANHLEGETNQDVIDAKLPLLQGAARGLQRLASRSLAASSQDSPQWVWAAGPGLPVPMLTLSTKAGAVTTRLVSREVWQVPLPGGLHLELVAIPGGPATLGSPDEEVGRKAYGHRPEATTIDVEEQRHVTVPPFAMARFPISQAQWRSLAGPEHRRGGGRELRPDPSQHKGADLPVESVSWHDCVEWRDRLNLWLSKQSSALGLNGKPLQLDLPSETLWEVACRAGSPSPFHFGDTLDAAWANYNGSPDYVYPGGRPGPYLQRPSPVGAYGLVNDWGLADLHGNVWEWCADRWHPSPQGGPVNGQVWMEPFEGLPLEQQLRLLRGGSWFNDPRNCRSAFRISGRTASHGGIVGFRLCCLPPGLPSCPSNP